MTISWRFDSAGEFSSPVIVLEENFELDRHINTICLPKELDTAKYISWDKCFATGWGKDSFGNSGRYQEIMKQVKLNFMHKCAHCYYFKCFTSDIFLLEVQNPE